MFAKLIDNELKEAPKILTYNKEIDDRIVSMVCSNPSEELLKNNGYKEVVDNSIVDKAGFYKRVSGYSEDSGHIYRNYEYVEKEIINEGMPSDNHFIYTAKQYEDDTHIINGWEATEKEVVEDTKPSCTELQYLVRNEEITDTQVKVHWTVTELSNAEKVAYLEAKYNMPRVIRELVLSAGSEYNKVKAQEIETYAVALRS